MPWRWAWSASWASRSWPTYGSSAGQRDGSDEAHALRLVGHLRHRGAVLLRAARRDLHLLARQPVGERRTATLARGVRDHPGQSGLLAASHLLLHRAHTHS